MVRWSMKYKRAQCAVVGCIWGSCSTDLAITSHSPALRVLLSSRVSTMTTQKASLYGEPASRRGLSRRVGKDARLIAVMSFLKRQQSFTCLVTQTVATRLESTKSAPSGHSPRPWHLCLCIYLMLNVLHSRHSCELQAAKGSHPLNLACSSARCSSV